MWPAMADTIRELRPRYVIVENVPALVRDRIAFGWILADLAELGFDAEWSLLSACAMGAPHPRERLLLVAYANCGDGNERLGTGRELGLARPRRRPCAGQCCRAEAGAWRDRVDWAVETACVDDRNADGAAARMVEAGGNAVVPQVAEHIGRMIMEAA
jgi:DNA (cytosine-5)-methyltransferase 1